jgi:hypothetical protein
MSSSSRLIKLSEFRAVNFSVFIWNYIKNKFKNLIPTSKFKFDFEDLNTLMITSSVAVPLNLPKVGIVLISC